MSNGTSRADTSGHLALGCDPSGRDIPARITSKLPNELFQRVIDHLGETRQLASLAKLMCVSRAMYLAVSPTLYETVVITRRNAPSFYLGLADGQPPVKKAVKVSNGISWAEFKSEAHKLEYRRALAIWKKGNNRKRKLFNVWPDVDIESDYEDDISHLPPSYPTVASQARKTRLLGLVQHLHFHEIPSTRICVNLCRASQKSKAPKMLSLKTLSIRPLAVWQMLDWEDRHVDMVKHPFTVYARNLEAKSVCVQLPVIDRYLEESYMASRIVSVEAHLSRDQQFGQHEYLRRQLRALVSGPLSAGTIFVRRLFGYGDYEITIHNAVSHIPRSLIGVHSCRVYFRPCVCLDQDVSDKIDDWYCYNHYENRVDANELPPPGREERPNKFASLTLLDLDGQSGSWQARRSDDSIVRHLKNKIGEADVRTKEFLERVVSMRSSQGLEPCVCCGNGQLSGAASSISYKPFP